MGMVGLITLMNPVEADWLTGKEKEKLLARYEA
jgi:hypothetical protein